MKKSIIKKITALVACAAMTLPVLGQTVSANAAESITPIVLDEKIVNTQNSSVISTVDWSGSYDWQHQNNNYCCWAATGSMLFTTIYGTTITQNDVAYGANVSITNTSGASLGDLGNAVDFLNYALNQSHTWTTFSPNSTSGLNQIKNLLNNGKAIAMSTSYTKNNGTTAYHMVLCTGYRIMVNNTVQFHIYDPAPSEESSGDYWTGPYNSTNVGYMTAIYGSVNIISCGYFSN
ncbi:MAG: hypothetical protein J6N70_06645 [Oribacterium sp.]|nr:hypothetical protein [Oribacterium sp.]